MKKLILKSTIILFLLSIVMISCNKEELLSTQNFKSISVESNLNDSKNTISIEGITTFEDMLWFENKDYFESAIEKLSNFQELDNDNFNKEYFKYADKELNKKESELVFDKLDKTADEIKFSEEGVFINFENILNFNSLRSKISNLETIFLNNTNPNWENNPNNHFIPFKEEQAVFNKYAEVRIGDDIYILREHYSIKVIGADYNVALGLRNKTEVNANISNIEIEYYSSNTNGQSNKTNSGCHFNSSLGFSYPSSNNYKHIDTRVGVRNAFFGIGNSIAYAKTTNYKKVGSKFRKKRAQTTSQVLGDRCSGSSSSFSTSFKTRNWKSLTQKMKIGNKNVGGENLRGYHKGINSYATYSYH